MNIVRMKKVYCSFMIFHYFTDCFRSFQIVNTGLPDHSRFGTTMFLFLLMICCSHPHQNSIAILKLNDSIDLHNVVAFYPHFDKGGNTSVDNDENKVLKWSGNTNNPLDWGYFNEKGDEIPYIKRNRDLGQTF